MTHKIVAKTTVSCDAQGCTNVIVWDDDSVARHLADKVIRQRYLWHIRPRQRHICPTCWSRGAR